MSIVQGVEKSIGVIAYLVEGTADRIRNAVGATRGLANHVDSWEALRQDAAIRHLSTNWIECRSGQRAKVEAVRDFVHPVSNRIVAAVATDGAAAKDQAPVGTISGDFETKKIGTSIEIDPVLGADGATVDMNYSISYDYAEPSTTPEPARGEGNLQLVGPTTELHRAVLNGSTTIWDGSYRLLGYWKPEGSPRFEGKDLLQAVFVKVDVIPLEE